MATIAQLQNLNEFVTSLPENERESLSIDAIYERWREQAFRQEDLLAVKASLRDFEYGKRGRPVAAFLAEFDAEQQAKSAGRTK